MSSNTIFDNSPNPAPRGPWMQQTFPQGSHEDSVMWNPDQEIGNPHMGHTSEETSWEGNPAAAFQVSHALD